MNPYRQPRDNEAISAAAARWVARRDAGLDATGQADLERWLAADVRHAAALAAYAQAWSTLDRTISPAQQSAVLLEVERRTSQRTRRRLQAAAAIAVFLGGVALLPWRTDADGTPIKNIAVAGGAMVQPEQRVLPDGSIVELKPGAEIATAFTAELRRVELRRGEAHFQVAKHAARPFVVVAEGVAVQAVGTAFVVQLNPHAVEVIVTEGIVAVEKKPDALAPAPSAATKPVATFGAGHRMVIGLTPAAITSGPQPVAQEELSALLAWRRPRLEFSGTPLAQAIALMNGAVQSNPGDSKLRLVLDPASRELANEPVSGFFRADNVEAFAHMLELSLNVRVDRQGDDIILHRAGPSSRQPPAAGNR